MKSVTLALASVVARSHRDTPVQSFVSKELAFYILSAPVRCWRDGVSRLASDVTASVVRLVVSPACQNASTDRSFRYGKRLGTAATLLLCCTALSGCVSATPLGKCVGLNGHEDPALTYEYSAQNIFWGVVGIEIIYPPIKVALDELKCPTGRVGGTR